MQQLTGDGLLIKSENDDKNEIYLMNNLWLKTLALSNWRFQILFIYYEPFTNAFSSSR